jgi:hypothetical protein
MDAIALKVEKKLKAYATLEEAIVEGSIVSVRFGLEDELFNSIVSHSLDGGMELFLLKSGSRVHHRMVSMWGPWLQKGRQSGTVPSHLTDDQIVEWIRYIHNVLMLRRDQGEDVHRELLRNFLVPSIVRQPL